MKEYEGMIFSASQAARIIGANSPNIISVWTNRGLLTPSNIINLSSKKRVFEFSYFNLFQAAILKELGDYFLIQYEFLNKLKGVEKGLGNKKLEHAIRTGKGFLVIIDRAQRGNVEESSIKAKVEENIEVEFVDKQESVLRRKASSGCLLVLNIAEIAKRLERGIVEHGNEY
jgi:hypothetical protein